MAVEAKNGIRSNLRFAKSLAPGIHQEIADRLAEFAGGKRQKLLMLHEADSTGFIERRLSPGEKVVLISHLQKAKSALDRMGFDDKSDRLPTPEQIVFRVCEDGVGGSTDGYGQFIWIHIPRNLPLSNIMVRNDLLHEIGHFVVDATVGSRSIGFQTSTETLKLTNLASGFDSESKGGITRRGVYGESLSELFMLDCKDNEEIRSTPYSTHIAFMVAFLNSYAQKEGVEPVAAFRELFRAHTTSDYRFQTKMVRHFGNAAISGLNTIARIKGKLDAAVLQNVAVVCNFSENYHTLQNEIDAGGIIKLDGLKGGFKS